jgi:hypothetical protein
VGIAIGKRTGDDSGTIATACKDVAADELFLPESVVSDEFAHAVLLVPFCAFPVPAGGAGLAADGVALWAAHAAAKLNEFREADWLEASKPACDAALLAAASWMAKVTERSAPQRACHMDACCAPPCTNWAQ